MRSEQVTMGHQAAAGGGVWLRGAAGRGYRLVLFEEQASPTGSIGRLYGGAHGGL